MIEQVARGRYRERAALAVAVTIVTPQRRRCPRAAARDRRAESIAKP
jgi:hypothetical protein